MTFTRLNLESVILAGRDSERMREETAEHLAILKSDIERIGLLVDDFMNFARPLESEPGRFHINDVVSAAVRRYAGAKGDIRSGVETFIDALRRELLIVALEEEPAESPAVPEQGPAAAGKRPDFNPPQLRKYMDMQDLLLLDPIHEVDEQGWPIAKDETAA